MPWYIDIDGYLKFKQIDLTSYFYINVGIYLSKIYIQQCHQQRVEPMTKLFAFAVSPLTLIYDTLSKAADTATSASFLSLGLQSCRLSSFTSTMQPLFVIWNRMTLDPFLIKFASLSSISQLSTKFLALMVFEEGLNVSFKSSLSSVNNIDTVHPS